MLLSVKIQETLSQKKYNRHTSQKLVEKQASNYI